MNIQGVWQEGNHELRIIHDATKPTKVFFPAGSFTRTVLNAESTREISSSHVLDGILYKQALLDGQVGFLLLLSEEEK